MTLEGCAIPTPPAATPWPRWWCRAFHQPHITDDAREVVSNLRVRLREAFQLRTGQLLKIQKQSGRGCLASTVMDVFVRYVDLMFQNAQPIGR